MTEINLQVEEKGDRIDRYLSQKLSDLSRSRIQQLIEQRHLKVNGKICTSKKASVQTGDRICSSILSPPWRFVKIKK